MIFGKELQYLTRVKRQQQTADEAADGYARWRSHIPFTNEQIAAALDEEANELEASLATIPTTTHHNRLDQILYFVAKRRAQAAFVRTGRLSSGILQVATSRLVKYCGICGKTALYRFGMNGRCRAHKHLVPTDVLAWRHTHEQRNAYRESVGNELETKAKFREKYLPPRRRQKS